VAFSVGKAPKNSFRRKSPSAPINFPARVQERGIGLEIPGVAARLKKRLRAQGSQETELSISRRA
jgi:hypothetical protein